MIASNEEETKKIANKLAKDIKTYMEELKTSIHSLKSIDKKNYLRKIWLKVKTIYK